MNTYETLLVERKESYVIVTLNRPKAMNTLNLKMKMELSALFTELEADRSILGVILTGAGRAFCAGSDVSTSEADKEANILLAQRDFVAMTHRIFNQIEAYPHPVIAAVNGFALGGGTELTLVCDLRMASTAAVFGLPEVNLGVVPCYGGTQRLPRLIGTGRAKDMLYSGRHVKADEAREMGLVNWVVEPEKLLEAAEEKLKEILAKAPIAVSLCKTAVNKGMEMPLHYGLEMETDFTGLCTGTEDVREGGMAFFEKRPPQFKNR